MRISDWSSDVCSSDLAAAVEREPLADVVGLEPFGLDREPIGRQRSKIQLLQAVAAILVDDILDAPQARLGRRHQGGDLVLAQNLSGMPNAVDRQLVAVVADRKSTRLNSSH